MKLFPALSLAALAAVFLSTSAFAEEKNGVQLTVQKATLDRADTHGGYYYDRIDRTQGLKASIKNASFKPLPEGEVEWQILVRKYYSTSVESYKGTEKLKALKPAEATDLTIGAAQITGWRDGTVNGPKDKLEWQVIVKLEGKEIIRSASMSGFDTLAKRAISVEKPKK